VIPCRCYGLVSKAQCSSWIRICLKMYFINSIWRLITHEDKFLFLTKRSIIVDCPHHEVTRDSSVGIAWTTEVQFPAWARFFSTAFIPALGPTQPPIQWVLRALSPGVKRQGREADQSPTSSAEVKNGGATPPLHLTSSWRSA
jgi:hypothetical protein